ncbi:MAG: serA [Microbacteriaceae bacterium]|nr:serA [Microbacteriaceae bacterium]
MKFPELRLPAVAQHQAVSARAGEVVPQAQPPVPGPVAVLPEPQQQFVDAVHAGGGVVAPLSGETRGIVWLDHRGEERLAAALDEHPNIGWVQLPWAGVDFFTEIMAAHSHLLWTSAKGAYAQPVAEHALALTLGLLRLLPQRARATSWPAEREGTSLYGLTVVVIGAGGIALDYIRLLQAFNARIIVVRRSAEHVEGAERTVTTDRLLEVLPEADVVMLAAALTGGSDKLIGAAELAAMKPTAYLVNIARGQLVDQDALVTALAAGTIAGAGLDVTDPEPLPDGHALWTEPRAIITPHSADTPAMIAPLLSERIRQNVEAFLGDARFVGVVDPIAGY